MAAPTQVQVFPGTETAQTTTLASSAPASSTTVGNTLFAFIGLRNTGGTSPTVSGVTDSAGNTWTQMIAVFANTTRDVEVWWAKNTTGSIASGTGSVTVTASSSTICFEVMEWSGLGTNPILDAKGSGTATGTAITASTSGATINPVEACIACVMVTSATATFSGTSAGYNMNARINSAVTSQGIGILTGYQVLAATGTQTFACTESQSNAWHEEIFTIIPNWSEGPADNAAISDAVTRQATFTRGTADSAVEADSPAGQSTLARATADSSVSADAPTRLLVEGRSPADTAAVADGPARLWAPARAVADTAATADSPAGFTGRGRTGTDQAVTGDAAVRAPAGLLRAPGDGAATADSARTAMVTGRSITDQAVTVDVASGKALKPANPLKLETYPRSPKLVTDERTGTLETYERTSALETQPQ